MNKNNERSLNKFIRYPPLITNKIKYFGGNFMCGITAFSGKEEALPFLLQGLSKLEYRGYDSAGVSLLKRKEDYKILSIVLTKIHL